MKTFGLKNCKASIISSPQISITKSNSDSFRQLKPNISGGKPIEYKAQQKGIALGKVEPFKALE